MLRPLLFLLLWRLQHGVYFVWIELRDWVLLVLQRCVLWLLWLWCVLQYWLLFHVFYCVWGQLHWRLRHIVHRMFRRMRINLQPEL